jgi:hypothetical protein
MDGRRVRQLRRCFRGIHFNFPASKWLSSKQETHFGNRYNFRARPIQRPLHQTPDLILFDLETPGRNANSNRTAETPSR